MKKSLVGVLGGAMFVFSTLIIPSVSNAQQTDSAPIGSPVCAMLSTNLGYGTSDANTAGSNSVSILQDFLNVRGYLSSQPTGFFGHMTMAAVEAFQSANDISSTGYVGPLTRAKIQAIDCGGIPSSTTSIVSTSTINTPSSVASNGSSQTTCPAGWTCTSITSTQNPISPSLSSTYSATSGSPGSSVTFYGTGFSAPSSVVTFSGNGVNRDVSPNSVSSNIITVIVPTDLSVGTYNVAITNLGNGIRSQSSFYPFTVTSQSNTSACPTGYSCSVSGQGNQSTTMGPVNCSTFSGFLSIGSTGVEVNTLQAFLISNGFLSTSFGFASGTFDSVTSASLTKFQTSMGIPATGVLDAITIAKINSSCGSGTTTSTTSNQPSITNITPNQGTTNTVVTIYGSNLTGASELDFYNTTTNQFVASIGNNAQYPLIINSSGTSLQFTISGAFAPNANGSWNLRVVTPAGSSNGLPFTVIAPQNTTTSPVVSTSTLSTTPTGALCTPITINGTTYSLSPCTITATMVAGSGNKNFSATIVGSGLYGFSTRGYGVGFPTYGIIANTASGGAQGSFPLSLYFNGSYLTSNGNQPQIYSGYLPIHIFQGSEGNDNNYLNLGITLTVFPAGSTVATSTLGN